jgi:hypothetical protein
LEESFQYISALRRLQFNVFRIMSFTSKGVYLNTVTLFFLTAMAFLGISRACAAGVSQWWLFPAVVFGGLIALPRREAQRWWKITLLDALILALLAAALLLYLLGEFSAGVTFGGHADAALAALGSLILGGACIGFVVVTLVRALLLWRKRATKCSETTL